MPKDTSVEALLKAARKELQSLGESVERLAQSYPEVFEASDLALRLDGFRAAHQEATERLKTPRLSIATIGTTSSGKSTIVNALIGRKLAPIDASEMSGGVLTFLHAGESRVVVEQTKGAVWETGEWTAQTDEEIYNRIRNEVMHPYHEERKKRSLAAPIVSVSSSLLPANDAQLLGIPSGVEIEIIDLPGLKSVQDQTNLTVIQERVKKSFSLVALDYMQVDDEHRGALLIELSKVVDAMGGRAENAMLFILNRVDQRGADDNEISHRIQQLKKEIKDKLKLREVPEVIAFSARPLYYAQCAWGSFPLSREPITSSHARNQFLNALFNDCFNFIWQKSADNTELAQWFLGLAAQLKSGADISDSDLRRFLTYIYDWSGGRELYQALNARIAKSWPEIILAPILLQSIQSCELLTNSIETFSHARKIKSKAEVKAACEEIKNTRKSLKKTIKQTEKGFQKELKDIVNLLKEGTQKEGDADRGIQVRQKAKANEWDGFLDLERAVQEVEIDLVDTLIIPVRDALQSKCSAFNLEDGLREHIGPIYANKIARAYDLAREKLHDFEAHSGYLCKRVQIDNTPQNIKKLEGAERAVIKLYISMREALISRAEFTIQTQAKKLERALSSAVASAEGQLLMICPEEVSTFNFKGNVLAVYKSKICSEPPVLPKDFFKIPPPVEYKKFSQEEVVGKKEYTKNIETGSCLKRKRKKIISEDIKETKEYCEVMLPDADSMARQWGDGIIQMRPKLWDVIGKWIETQLEVVADSFQDSIQEIFDLSNSALEEQLLVIDGDFQAELSKWKQISSDIRKTSNLSKKLQLMVTQEKLIDSREK